MITPLSEWYPTMHSKWVREGRRVFSPKGRRTGYTIHHTAGGTGQDPVRYAQSVASWHYQKWARPGGYNFLIGTDGSVFEMCGWDWVGAHAPGCNYDTIGVSFQGLFSATLPNDGQLAAFAGLVGANSVPNVQRGHRQCKPSTPCPGGRLYAALPLDVQQGDVMTPDQEAKLDEVLERLSDRETRGHIAREVEVIKQAVGRLDAAGLTPDSIARAVVQALPAGTISAKQVADAVADVLAARLGDV